MFCALTVILCWETMGNRFCTVLGSIVERSQIERVNGYVDEWLMLARHRSMGGVW